MLVEVVKEIEDASCEPYSAVPSANLCSILMAHLHNATFAKGLKTSIGEGFLLFARAKPVGLKSLLDLTFCLVSVVDASVL